MQPHHDSALALAAKFAQQPAAVPGVPADSECPLRTVLDLIGDRWSMLLLAALAGGPKRFSALERTLPTISKRMLTQTLQALQANGLVDREVTPSVPPKVTYSLTTLGQSFTAPLLGLVEWAQEHAPDVAGARRAFLHLNT